MKVRQYCDTLLEIVGYTSKDANSYIEKYFSNHDDPSLAKKLIKNLDRNPHLRNLTANPLNTALLCLVFEDACGMFPYNRTMLYDELISCVLRRHFSKQGIHLDDKDPIEVCTDQLNQLGELALEALLKDQLAFTPGELKSQSTEFLEFGFLSREASASRSKPKPTYAFTHKTFQEYFAAFYLAHELLTGESDKAALLAQLSPVNKYWQVWEFLITMAASKSDDLAVLMVSSLCASFQHKTPEQFFCSAYCDVQPKEDSFADSLERAMEAMNNWDDDSDYDSEDDYSYETDDDVEKNVSEDHRLHFAMTDVCRDASYYWDEDLQTVQRMTVSSEDIKETFLTTTIYIIAQCEQPKSELKSYQKEMAATLARCFPMDKITDYNPFYDTSVASRYILLLCEYLKGNCQLKGLSWFEKLDELTLATIEHVLQSSHQLTHLRLAGDLRITSLTPALQASRTLTHLNLRAARIGNTGAKALGEVLQSNRSLTHLTLLHNMITHIGAEALAKGLLSNDVLVHLEVRDNKISDQGAVALSKALESNRTLSYLNVAFMDIRGHRMSFRHSEFDGCIGDSGVTAIAQALRSNNSLICLDLQGNVFRDSAVAALGEALQSNCSLTHLYLRGYFGTQGQIHFGNSAAGAFSKALQSSGTQLTRLDLFNTSISSSCVITLAEGLQSNRTLERLDLSRNEIECSGAAALAQALKTNQTLTHLQLSKNKIGDSGAKEFVEALQCNETLIVLDLADNLISWLREEHFKAFSGRLYMN